MVDKNLVIETAEKYLSFSIRKYANHLPEETKEDIKQIGFVRVLEAYEKIDSKDSWKAYIQNHCNGAVLDFLKSPKQMKFFNTSEYLENTYSADALIERGIYYNSANESTLDIKWDLVARMASQDDHVFLVARFILGHTLTDVAENSKYSREMVYKKLGEFIERLDDPFEPFYEWVSQIIYAFGLSEHFYMEEKDNGLGWDLEPIDIFSKDLEYKKKVYTNQMELI